MKPVLRSKVPVLVWLRPWVDIFLLGLSLLLWQSLLIGVLLGTGWLLDDEIPAGARLWLSEQVLALKPQSVTALRLKAQAWIYLQLGRLTRLIPSGQMHPALRAPQASL